MKPRPGTTITALVRHDCEVQEGAWVTHTAELEMHAVRVSGGVRWDGKRCDGSAIQFWDEAVR